MIAEQIRAEEAADKEFLEEAQKAQAELLRLGNVDKLPRGKAIIARMFGDVKLAIEAEQAKKHRGVGAALRGWLREIDADVAAVIALRTTLQIVLQSSGMTKLSNGTLRPATFQRITTAIGREWAMEIKVQAASRINPIFYEGAVKRLKETNTTSEKHTRMAMSRVVQNSLDGVYDEDLTNTEYMHLGKTGLQACMDVGLVDVVRSTNNRGNLVEYQLTDPVRVFLHDEKAAEWLASPNDLTMVVPPLPWERIVGGGFHTEKRQVKYPLVRTHRKVRAKHLRAYRGGVSAETLPKVFEAVNYLQSIPYQMDGDVFEHVHRVWREGGNSLGVPPRQFRDRPECPMPPEWIKEGATEDELSQFNRWKRHVFAWHTERLKHRSVAWEVSNFVKSVGKYTSRSAYFAMFLDTRSRMYYRGAISPQGSDGTKAVLHFGAKKALGPRGAFWLKVHIANCFGVDDIKFKARAAWTDEHWDLLLQGVDRPEDSDLYRANKDNPFMAVAAVRDLAAAYASGNPATYESGIIVHMDATCSGLQHFSALLRDGVGGQYVNLTPGGERKADIYRRVAELAMLQVARDAAGGMECAQLWEALGVSRKLAKGPVMTYVYGATLRSVADGICAFLDDEGYDYKVSGVSEGKMAMYLAKLLFKAIEDTVPAAANAMRWLKQVVREHPRDKPIVFSTLLDFPVHHDYPDSEQTRVRVRSCGVEYVVMHNDLEVSKTTRMQNAIAPNFVHSLDATHLTMVALRMSALGLHMAAIHDSFGTHAADVDAMHQVIRECFVEMYADTDLLKRFADEVQSNVTYLGQGTLDLHGVLESEFFFC